MDNGWFAYQCNTGEILFFYNKFSGEYRWLSCTCVQKAKGTLSKDENSVEVGTNHMSPDKPHVRSIGIETDYSLTSVPTRTKELRTQGTQTDVTDFVPLTTPSNETCMKEPNQVNLDLSNSQVPVIKPLNAEKNITKGTDNKVKLFPCRFCDKAFTSSTFLAKHLKCHSILGEQEQPKNTVSSNHGQTISGGFGNISDQQKADITSEKSVESITSETSLLSLPSNNSLKCFQCNMRFTSSKALDDHFGASHYADDRCEACEKNFSCKKSFKLHLISHHFGEKHHCPHCKKTFAVRLGLLRHQRFKHNTFWNDDLLRQLRKLENPNTDTNFNEVNPGENIVADQQVTFKCDGCNVAYGLYSELIDHQKTCEKVQSQSSHDSLEMEPLFRNRRFWCIKCKTSYKTKRALIRHKKTKVHMSNERHSTSHTKPEQNHIASMSSYYCQNCNSSFENYISLVQHKTLNNCFEKKALIENNIFKCLKCPEIFFSVAAIARHTLTHIGRDKDSVYPCTFCKKRFTEKDSLERHLYYHLQVYNCSRCNQTFERHEQLQEHNKTVHCEDSNFSCTVCNKKFTHMAGLTNHYRSHNKKSEKKCSFCGKVYNSFTRLKKHTRRCKNKPASQKQEKVRQPVSNDNLIEVKEEPSYNDNGGVDTPVTTIPYQPLKYNGVISSDTENAKHDKTAPQCPDLRERKFDVQPVNTQDSNLDCNERKFQCFQCEQLFSTRYFLLKHQRVMQHEVNPKSLTKRFKCKVCKKAFQSYSVYYQHQFQHNRKNSCKCKTCGTCFSTEKLLSSHKCALSSTKKTEFPCRFCGSVFYTSQGLSNHLRGHKYKKKVTYECKVCQKVFENYRRLSKHRRSAQHSNNKLKRKSTDSELVKKLYECGDCGKYFSTSHHVIRHRLNSCKSSHKKATSQASKETSEMKCFTCSQSFPGFPAFKEHFATTHGEGFPCWLCPKSFSSYSNLNRHVRDSHQLEKQFYCNWCFKEFSRVNDYITHVGNNSTTSKHVCKFCLAEFSLCSSLTDHLKTNHKSE